jgi:hypothetical protein
MSALSPQRAALEEVPPVREQVLKAAQSGQLVIFVGAGVSRLVGGPSWEALADDLLKQLAEKNELTRLSYAELEQLKCLEPKKRISIAMDICEEAKFPQISTESCNRKDHQFLCRLSIGISIQ